MTTATKRVQIKPYDTHVVPTRFAGEMANAAVWKKGWLIAQNSAGLLVPFTATTGLTSAGYAEKDEDNTANDNRKANVLSYALSVLMKVGDELAQTDFPCLAYGTDNQTVQKTATGVSPAGVFLGLDPTDATRAIVWLGPVAASLAAVKVLADAGLTMQKRTVTILETDLTAAVNGTGQAINIGATLPANARIVYTTVKLATPFTGGSASAVTLIVGTSADNDAIIGSSDVFAAAVDGQASTRVAGISPNKHFVGAGAQLIATLTPDGGHTLLALTAGSVTVDVGFVVLA